MPDPDTTDPAASDDNNDPWEPHQTSNHLDDVPDDF